MWFIEAHCSQRYLGFISGSLHYQKALLDNNLVIIIYWLIVNKDFHKNTILMAKYNHDVQDEVWNRVGNKPSTPFLFLSATCYRNMPKQQQLHIKIMYKPTGQLLSL